MTAIDRRDADAAMRSRLNAVLADLTKMVLVRHLVWGVPVYRQRFSLVASRPGTERVHRLIRLAWPMPSSCVPFEANLECDETTFGGTLSQMGHCP